MQAEAFEQLHPRLFGLAYRMRLRISSKRPSFAWRALRRLAWW